MKPLIPLGSQQLRMAVIAKSFDRKGNAKIHMKNFSILYQGEEIVLSPAYDLINSALVYPKEKEDMAIMLSGRKIKIKLKDFQNLAKALGLLDKVFQRVISKFAAAQDKVFDLIDQSFLSDENKAQYKKKLAGAQLETKMIEVMETFPSPMMPKALYLNVNSGK
ncbi:hypothetical protein AAKU52_000224 [Pedobacter sp. CG_S7]|uniref:HipA domain-containing protein n=1 Tax=Pedobacter sp. CG_S7 TaxID=3143930 RepID=UPI003392FF11